MTVRSGQQHAKLIGGFDQFVFQAAALLSRLPIAPTGDKGGPHADLGTGAQQFDVGRNRRAHKDEVSRIRRNLLYRPIGGLAENLRTVTIDRKDFALIPEASEVVQRDKPKFPRMGGRPCNDHAARVKQGAEAFQGLFRGTPLNRWSVVGRRIRDDQGINRNGFSLDNNQRVHVHALNIGPLDGQVAQPN